MIDGGFTDKSLLKEIALEQSGDLEVLGTGVARDKMDVVLKYLSIPHSVVITGLRRTGKSTLFAQIIKKHYSGGAYYFNFEDERLLNFKTEDFNSLYEVLVELFGDKKVFFFDEIQNVPDWESFVRRMQDKGFKFFITGSNASLLSRELGTRLTGRTVSVELFPFSFKEYLSFKGEKIYDASLQTTKSRGKLKRHFNDYLHHGGMPEYLKYKDQSLLKRLYEDILYRDIVVRCEIKETKTLRELGLYLLSNIGGLYSTGNLKNLLSLGSVNTVKSYIGYLEDSYLLFSLSRFSYSLKQQGYYPKKCYCIDNGLVESIAFQFSKNKGKYLENLVFLELKRKGKEVFYYKTSKDKEVDFLVHSKNKPEMLIQVTDNMSNESTKTRETESLLEAMNELKMKEGLILTSDQEEEVKVGNKTITILPIYKWLLI